MDRRDLLTLSAALALAAVAPGCSSPGPGDSPSPGRSAPASTTVTPGPSFALGAFAGALLGRLAPAPRNVVFSPWSIAMVLSMVREGAVGATASELDAVLGGPAPGVGDGLAAGARLMQSARGTLRVGNSLWGQQDLTWKQPFLDRLATTYGSPLRRCDYRSAPEPARRDINAWVDQQTKGKIPELLSPGLVKESTRLVLVNALHFQAPWAEPLAEAGRLPFTTGAGSVVSVPTLTGAGVWPWLAMDGLLGTAVPCEGGDFALVVVLPEDPASGTPVGGSVFAEVVGAPAVPVSVQLPAWTFRLRVLLTQVLQQLGVVLAFDPDRADFSGMTAQERLFLDFVVHEAVIEVNAKGIEAAAATAAGMAAAGAPLAPERLVLDRPFTYALVHVPTRTPLFLGQVADPTSQGSA